MKELFMLLLLNLKNHGEITAANLYRGSDFATLEVEGENAIYEVAIRKKEKKDAN